MEEKKYTGRGGYHGGGRPAKGDAAKRTTMSIAGTASEIEKIKKLAAENGKTISRFVIEKIL